MKTETQSYSKAIYSRPAIVSAIQDYRKIARISLKENETHYVCEFTKCIVDAQRVMNEFNNYLIELLNTQGEDAGT